MNADDMAYGAPEAPTSEQEAEAKADATHKWTFDSRCELAEKCLPVSGFRTQVERLHADMLAELETLRTSLAHWKVFGEHAEGERSRLSGEQAVLVRLLLEADKVVSTIEGECQEEWDQLADLRRAIAAATIPHRPEEADLLSLRACLGA